MKRRSLPLWLLRDVPALVGVFLSFWPLMILVISSGWKAMRGEKVDRSVYDRIAVLLAPAESWLDHAFWRQAYRRLGWSPRLAAFNAIPPPANWDETARRFQGYRQAFLNMESVVASYVEHLRQTYRISEREAASASAHAPARAAHHALFGVATSSLAAAPLALILSSARSARPSKDARGHAHARGPPQHAHMQTRPTSQAPPARAHRHARNTPPLRPREPGTRFTHSSPNSNWRRPWGSSTLSCSSSRPSSLPA